MGSARLAGALAACALATPALVDAKEPPVPALAKQSRIVVKAIVVANFEPGKDKGDAPGEFQFWAEREHLDEAIAVKGLLHPLLRNKDGLYGVVWGSTGTLMGTPSEQLMALLLDRRFDFSHTYWLFTGISGIDPQAGSVGSAAWARWVVQADTLREFDDREVPKDWPYGLFAIGAKKPNQLPDNPDSFAGMTDAGALAMSVRLNPALVNWAFAQTKDITIPDTPALAKAREAWVGYPEAQRPPQVMLGETLGTLRYWHGPSRTQWARDWVKLWTRGADGVQGRFVMTNMESQLMAGTMVTATKAGLVDWNRVLVLRTGSNPSMPPPGVSAIDSVGDEGPGQIAAYEANYRVGAPVLHEILRGWAKYRDHLPQ